MKGVVYSVRALGWVTCRWLRLFWPGCLHSPINGLSLRELPPPALPGEDWVLCRTLLGGICGSDLAILAQRVPPDSFLQAFSTFPCVLGHENVAEVVEVGPSVDAAWVGRRVTVDPGLPCRVRGIEPPCPACQAGRYGACENFATPGPSRLPPGSCLGYCGPLGGSWGEYFAAHVSQLIAPPAELSDEQAVLTDPLACGLHAVLRADLSKARRVFVYGAGVLGLAVVWALRASGWDGAVEVAARHGHQGELARALGADAVLALPAGRRARFEAVAARVGGRVVPVRFGNAALAGGYDVVFECTGAVGAMEEAFKWARGDGQVVLVGTGHGRGADLTAIWFGELTVLGASGRAEEDFQGRRVHTYRLAHELMLASGSDVTALITHRFGVADYRSALAAAMGKARHRSVKVVFDFRGGEERS